MHGAQFYRPHASRGLATSLERRRCRIPVGNRLQTRPERRAETWRFAYGGANLKKDWLKALDAATTVGQVIELVDDFVESRSDVYWAGVPEALRRPTITTEAQIEQWHHALVQAISQMPSPGSPMQELAVFSLRAAVRFHQIRLREHRSPSNDGGLEGRAGRPSDEKMLRGPSP